jgi:hypothetical protein
METLIISLIVTVALIQSVRVIRLKRRLNEAESAIRYSDKNIQYR